MVFMHMPQGIPAASLIRLDFGRYRSHKLQRRDRTGSGERTIDEGARSKTLSQRDCSDGIASCEPAVNGPRASVDGGIASLLLLTHSQSTLAREGE